MTSISIWAVLPGDVQRAENEQLADDQDGCAFEIALPDDRIAGPDRGFLVGDARLPFASLRNGRFVERIRDLTRPGASMAGSR